MTRSRRHVGSIAALALGLAISPALAQPGSVDSPTPPPPASETQPISPTALPPERTLDEVQRLVPQVRLGATAERLRVRQSAIPIVVLVPDGASYARAIAAWTPLVRFPVLIDDGTSASRDDAARFIRGFQPQQVVRWAAPDAPDGAGADTPAQVEALIDDALHAVWPHGTPDSPTIFDAVRSAADIETPGVVVGVRGDTAWPAALALAAGRGQPIIWIDARQNIDDALSKAEGDAMCIAIEQALTDRNVLWASLGDAVDSISLCANTPVRTTSASNGEWIATTDRLGRLSDTDRTRWAWASQIHGTEPQSAYRAMCALFLAYPSVWMFDGYPEGQPWSSYALRFAAQTLDSPGINIHITERPSNGLTAWRSGTMGALTANLLMVNTKGMKQFFELPDGTLWCGDLPHLINPAAVYFIHSWSAFQPGDRDTLAGRWFERGAYAYCGSVQEPYLSAFVPPVAIASRLKVGAPWAVVCRTDESAAWRVATFGDPLIVLGPPQPRSTAPLPLVGASSVEDAMRAALREGDMAQAVGLLVLLGRDADAARLVTGLRTQAPARITPAVAAAAMGALFRTASHRDFQALYPMLEPDAARDPVNVDMLWVSCRASLPADAGVMGLLRPRIRSGQQTADTTDLALLGTASGDREQAISMLTEYRQSRRDSVSDLRIIDRAMEIIRGGSR